MTPSEKRARFVKAYRVDSNAKKAAIKAGYSKATAAAAGSRLLKHPEVVAALKMAAGGMQKDAPAALAPPHEDVSPLRYMLSVVNDPTVDRKTRLEAARSAAPYVHARLGLGIDAKVGKKEQKQQTASEAAKTSRFASMAAPPLPVRH